MNRAETIAAPVDWTIARGLVPYPVALDIMQRRTAAIARGEAAELVWLLEHPPLYTAGTSARAEDLMQPAHFPVYETGRGGQFTYHGPGQRVAYVMLDVRQRFGSDVRAFVSALEAWIIEVLAQFGLDGGRRMGRTGVWVEQPHELGGGDAKIAAIGIRISRGISLHGVSVNVSPDLSHYSGIVPCGIRDAGVTSLAALGIDVTLHDVDVELRRIFERRFGPLSRADVSLT